MLQVDHERGGLWGLQEAPAPQEPPHGAGPDPAVGPTSPSNLTEQTSIVPSLRRMAGLVRMVSCFCFVFGFFVCLVVGSMSTPPAPEESGQVTSPPATPSTLAPSTNSPDDCVARREGDSLVLDSPFSTTFFNYSCIIAGDTGDACDVHIAEACAAPRLLPHRPCQHV